MPDYALPQAIRDPALHHFCRIAQEAGSILLRAWGTEQTVIIKDDGSPVTEADITADRHITAQLRETFPDIEIVSEEDARVTRPEAPARFFLVDPLDGTKSFIRGGKNFTVNIALIDDTQAVAGVVLLPAHDVMYLGSQDRGAWRIHRGRAAESITTRTVPATGHHAILSHSRISPEVEAFLATIAVEHTSSAASSLKFCKVAEGSADCYPRFGPTSEWDTAAGQAVLEAAGGRVTTPEGAPFLYGKPHFLNGNFIAWGK